MHPKSQVLSKVIKMYRISTDCELQLMEFDKFLFYLDDLLNFFAYTGKLFVKFENNYILVLTK